MRLRAGRTLINLIDFNLMVTIHLRMKVARMIGRYKIDHDLPTFVPAREAAVIESRLRLAKVFASILNVLSSCLSF